MSLRIGLLLILILALGCGGPGYKVAKVSGKVTLDNKPLVKAWVTFMPMGSSGDHNPGPTSAGQTNENGEYSLRIDPEHPGAVVGKHKVSISAPNVSAAAADADAGGAKGGGRDRVPEKYNLKSTLMLEVPAAGKTDANFDLTTR